MKTQYNTDKSGAEKKIDDADKKIPDISGLTEKVVHNAKTLRLKVKYLVSLAYLLILLLMLSKIRYPMLGT